LSADGAERLSAGDVVLELPLQAAAVRLWMASTGALIGVAAAVWTTIACIALGVVGLTAALPGLLLVAAVVHYWRQYAECFSCRLLADGLLVRRGVWWRTEIFVPRSRIQHTEVNQGPLARRHDLAQIAVHTAGSHAARIEVDGLALAQATQLRDQLLGRDGHDAV
jgi:membrane protein YdbS with pleckstrin-like domain